MIVNDNCDNNNNNKFLSNCGEIFSPVAGGEVKLSF
jgi:hypothetical protein